MMDTTTYRDLTAIVTNTTSDAIIAIRYISVGSAVYKTSDRVFIYHTISN
jgi:hypothetical protein